MVTHNWWHQALFALELGRHEEVLRLYDTEVWGVAMDYTQDQINAVSLLARLELAGVAVGDRWRDVANYLAHRLDDHVLPFLDMQYLYGLARADRPEADTLMRHIGRARSGPGFRYASWRNLAARGPSRKPWPAGPCAGGSGSALSMNWAWHCPGWPRLAAAMRSATCLPRFIWTP